MGARIETRTDRLERTAAAWMHLYKVDVVTLVLGTALMLRFWYLFFGIGDLRLMAAFTILTACEVTKRLTSSFRAWQRPRLFCADLRSDLMAAIALGTAPWPITLPVLAASPLWMFGQPLAQAGVIGPVAAGVALAASVRRLVTA
jgi:hypothetical protein